MTAVAQGSPGEPPAGRLPAGVTRRGLLGAAAVGGVGTALAPISAARAAAASTPFSGPAPSAAGPRDARTLTLATGTNASATVSPDGDRLVIEVQGVLWAVSRRGGRATALTAPALEPTRPAWSPDGSAWHPGGDRILFVRADI
jgi:hypothetical protein